MLIDSKRIRIPSYAYDRQEPTGFPESQRQTTTISFNDATRTFSISGTYHYWQGSLRYNKSGVDTLQISDVEGLHFIFYNKNVLEEYTEITKAIYTTRVYVSALYWDATNKKNIYFADERHGIAMSGETHMYLHYAVGSVYHKGLGLSNFVVDGDGSLDTHAQFSCADGEIFDEDLPTTIQNNNPQNLYPIAYIPVYYKSGANGYWRKDTARAFACKNIVGGRLAYNQFIAGVWKQTEVGNNQYVLSHIFATNDINNPIVCIQGQNVYTNIGEAREGATNSINNLISFGFPFTEFVVIATIIFKTSSAFLNIPKAVIVSTDIGDNYVDFRLSSALSPSAMGINDHGNLDGLNHNDHPQYNYIINSRAVAVNSLAYNKDLMLVTSTAPVTITLVNDLNAVYTIKKVSADVNNIVIVGQSGTIDGQPNITFNAQWEVHTIGCNGTNFYKI